MNISSVLACLLQYQKWFTMSLIQGAMSLWFVQIGKLLHRAAQVKYRDRLELADLEKHFSPIHVQFVE